MRRIEVVISANHAERKLFDTPFYKPFQEECEEIRKSIEMPVETDIPVA